MPQGKQIAFAKRFQAVLHQAGRRGKQGISNRGSAFGSPLELLVEHAGSRRITSPLGKAGHFEDPHAAIEPDGQDIAELHAMARRPLADAIDADMSGLDQRGGTGAGFHHPRMP
jgi:hypothetical protein